MLNYNTIVKTQLSIPKREQKKKSSNFEIIQIFIIIYNSYDTIKPSIDACWEIRSALLNHNLSKFQGCFKTDIMWLKIIPHTERLM